MSEILVLVEHVEGQVKKVTLELLTLARKLGAPAAVWTGAGYSPEAAAKLAEYGAEKIYVADSAEVSDYVVAPKAELLAHLVAERSPAAVLVAATAEAKEIAGRLAIKIDSGVLTDVVGIEDGLVADQSIFGGGVNVRSRVTKGTPIVAVRPNSTPVEAAAGAGAEERVSFTVSDAAKGARIVERVKQEKGARPELTEAAIVVSGGRGVGSADKFSIIEELADSLGAAVGASRAATDAVGTRTSSRSARPARPSRRSSTSRRASPVPSSTGPACRPPRRSSRSTRTPRRRSSSSPTSASWATCTRWSRS